MTKVKFKEFKVLTEEDRPMFENKFCTDCGNSFQIDEAVIIERGSGGGKRFELLKHPDCQDGTGRPLEELVNDLRRTERLFKHDKTTYQ